MSLSDVPDNTATAIAAAPIGISMAHTLGAAGAAFCAFLTPIGHENDTSIFGPGGYRFGDSRRMGLPLEVLVIGVSRPAILVFWPLRRPQSARSRESGAGCLAPPGPAAHERRMTLRFTILGCGSSGGVPRLGGHWGACDPNDPKNRRRRCSLLVERVAPEGVTRVLVDTSPDMRQQLLDAGVGALDGVVWTHAHADHVHGIDDLRMIVFNRRRLLDVWADAETHAALQARFAYVFETPPGSNYPPLLAHRPLAGPVVVEGAGGPVEVIPVPVGHGDIAALGLRIGGLVYMPDVKTIPDTALPFLEGIEVWVLDALRRSPHPSHLSLSEALDWIARMRPARAVLTNMHVDLDRATVDAETPAAITPAFDGMVIELEGA